LLIAYSFFKQAAGSTLLLPIRLLKFVPFRHDPVRLSLMPRLWLTGTIRENPRSSVANKYVGIGLRVDVDWHVNPDGVEEGLGIPVGEAEATAGFGAANLFRFGCAVHAVAG
jgi:hypothetical protein